MLFHSGCFWTTMMLVDVTQLGAGTLVAIEPKVQGHCATTFAIGQENAAARTLVVRAPVGDLGRVDGPARNGGRRSQDRLALARVDVVEPRATGNPQCSQGDDSDGCEQRR